METKCKSCGKNVSANMKFCASCGTPIEQSQAAPPQNEAHTAPAQNTTPPPIPDAAPSPLPGGSPLPGAAQNPVTVKQNKSGPGGFLIPAIIAAVVVIVAAVYFIAFSGGGYEQSKGTVYITQDSDVVVIYPNNKPKAEIYGELSDSGRNMDGTKAYALIAPERQIEYWEHSLYHITDKPALVSEEVFAAVMSASGNAILYAKEPDFSNYVCELWLFKDGKNTKLSDECYMGVPFVLSPNGDTAAYVISEGDRLTGILWNGKYNDLGRDVYTVAVANKAKYVYYVKSDSLYVQKGTDVNNREKLGEDVYDMYANKDLSQVVFNAGSRSYISVKGGSRESLSGYVEEFILPSKIAYFTNNNNIYMLGISSFSNTFYLNLDDSVIRINGKREASSIARNVTDAYVASDGKTLLYQRSRSIYKLNGTKENAEPDEIIKGDVRTFVPTDDGKAIFYVTNDDELFYQKGTGKPVTVSNYFTGRAYLSLFKGKTLYYTEDNELYYSDGERGKVISGFDGDVSNVFSTLHHVIVYSSDNRNYFTYRSTDGKKFELVREQ